MYGAIIGDVVGSAREFNNIKSKDFELVLRRSKVTDDSVMTVAIAKALMRHIKEGTNFAEAAVSEMQYFGHLYPHAGYGRRFREWLKAKNPQPYMSYGNGSAMRVSPCGLIAESLEEAEQLAVISASVTHNHREGIKGAKAVAASVYLAEAGKSKEEICAYIEKKYYSLDFTLDEIRPDYSFDVTCQGSVPQAIEAFKESTGFEDAIRNAVSLGGDSDTIAAMTGSIAWSYYGRDGLTSDMKNLLLQVRIPHDLKSVIEEFNMFREKI